MSGNVNILLDTVVVVCFLATRTNPFIGTLSEALTGRLLGILAEPIQLRL